MSRAAASPHLGTRKIVRAAEGPPNEAALGRVEGEPVGGVAPGLGDSFSGASPGLPAIRALKEAHVRVVHVDVARIEGIELHAVVCGYIEAAGGPTAGAGQLANHLMPGLRAVLMGILE